MLESHRILLQERQFPWDVISSALNDASHFHYDYLQGKIFKIYLFKERSCDPSDAWWDCSGADISFRD